MDWAIYAYSSMGMHMEHVLRVGANDTVRDGTVDEYGRITGFSFARGRRVTVIIHAEGDDAGRD